MAGLNGPSVVRSWRSQGRRRLVSRTCSRACSNCPSSPGRSRAARPSRCFGVVCGSLSLCPMSDVRCHAVRDLCLGVEQRLHPRGSSSVQPAPAWPTSSARSSWIGCRDFRSDENWARTTRGCRKEERHLHLVQSSPAILSSFYQGLVLEVLLVLRAPNIGGHRNLFCY